MKVRTVTCFVNVGDPVTQASAIHDAGQLARDARKVLESTGLPVQTIRLATQPLTHLPSDPLGLAAEVWAQCADAGFEYLSLGPVLADTPNADLSLLDAIPELIRATEDVFAGVLVAGEGQGLHLEAIWRAAKLVREIAHTTEHGFGNLRVAILSNVGPHAPFFPAAYHDGGPPAIALGTESADLAMTVFSEAAALPETASLDEARTRLTAVVGSAGRQIADLIRPLAERYGYRFAGIDFSLAPFPNEACSIATAVERLGVDRFGAPGTLFAASLLTDCLRQAEYPRCGFNGLMLPVLEDVILAARGREGLITVNDLLLYSAVCGTGLDAVPLPGDVGEAELAGILLDVAALALRLDKPLTARLMPIPGARAGDITEFDFTYFANCRVLDVKGLGSPGLFSRETWLTT